jgi:uncharacterized membrane protein YfcA
MIGSRGAGSVGLRNLGRIVIEGTNVVLAAFGLFFAGLIKGGTGLGYSSCALPFLAAAMGLKPAIVLVVLPAMISNIVVVATTGHFQESLKRFWILYAATLPGIIAGTFFLAWIDQKVATISLGVLIAVYSVIALVKPAMCLPSGLERPLQMPVGLINGFFTGLTGSQVLPLVPYMLALKLDANRMVQAVNLAVTIASGFMTLALLHSGLMSVPSLGVSVAAIIPAMAGIWLGTRARGLVPVAHFRSVVLIVLGVLGVLLIARQAL